ncbi:MAG: hypothetical protein J6C15_00315 [Bacteroidaceae bacterium]|nr:hypothetical protein [Bacteroidaceae bacterium]
MRRRLLLLAVTLCLGFGSYLSAQQVPALATKSTLVSQDYKQVSDAALLKIDRATRDLNDKKQEPKWMTNLPMDSAMYSFTMYGFDDACTTSYSTLIARDIVEKFVGNKITTIKTILPKGGYDVSFWIIDATGQETEPLWITYLDGSYMANVVVDVPCDYTIDEVRDLQVGYTINFPAGLDYVNPTVVPCFRNNTFLLQSNSSEYNANRVYNYADFHMVIKGYDYYFGLPFYCITEGDKGFSADGIVFEGVNHSKVLLGEAANLNAYFTNYGCNPIQNISFEAKVGNQVNVVEFDQPVPFLGSGSLKASIPADEKAERIPLNLRVKSINQQEVTEDISAQGSVTVIDPDKSVERMVVMEEYGGTWCGWCPRGMVGMEMLAEEYPGQFIPIGIHYGDPMQHSSFDEVLMNYGGGFPGCAINRLKLTDPYYGDKTGTPFGIDELILPMIYTPTEAKVNIESATLDAEKATLSVKASAQFFIDCNMEDAPYSLAYVITEDGVSGKNLPASQRKDYLQVNYFNNMTQYNSDPNLKHLVTKPSYWETEFNHVARFIDKAYGLSGSLPGTFQNGDVMTHSYEISLPDNINDYSKCTLVALLLDNGSGEIINASSIALASLTGVEQAPTSATATEIVVETNGVTVNAPAATVYVYTLDGRLFCQQEVCGSATLDLPAGNYVVRAVSGKDVVAKKVAL